MDSISLIESFLGNEDENDALTAVVTKTPKPLLPKCPPKDTISVAQFQFFDNSNRPRKKGHSQYALKIEIYHGDVGEVVFQQPDWWRVVQLIAPKDVVAWARRKHSEGRFDQTVLDQYETSLQVVGAFLVGDPNGRVWMGHISDPNNKGKHYYPGQFVIVMLSGKGELEAHLLIEGEMVSVERFVRDRTKGKDGARDKVGYYDPFGILPRQLQFLRDKRAREAHTGRAF